MRQRLSRLLLSTYPRQWRDRYGQELQHLVADLEDSGKRATPLVLNVLAVGLAERVRTKAIRVCALGAAIVCVLAIALVTLQSSNVPSQSGAAAQLADRGSHSAHIRALCGRVPGTKRVVVMNPNAGVVVVSVRCNGHGQRA
jgi:hypothetical protein